MKKFLILLLMLFCGTAYTQTETLNWYIGDDVYATTTCESGNDILLPTTPTKRGYTFKGWAEYQPIEYLESTGTQYIDTGVLTNNSLTINISFECIDCATGGYSIPVGSEGKEAINFGLVFSPDGLLGYNVAERHNLFTNISIINRETIIANLSANNGEAIFSVNGYIFSTSYSKNLLDNKYSMFLFGFSIKGINNFPFIGKIYEAKIYDNDVLIRDFVPALDSAGTPCMFDKVEHKFYYNQGTGQFIAGPIIGAE